MIAGERAIVKEERRLEKESAASNWQTECSSRWVEKPLKV